MLKQLGVEFETLAMDIDESWDGREAAEDYVKRLALEKARAAKPGLGAGNRVLAADTEVVVDGQIQGKPSGRDEAMTMLQNLSGRCHEVLSAVVLVDETELTRLSVNRVCFARISEQQCHDYCETGEPFDKAGGYGIQGGAAVFLRRLEGSYSSVMGLPLTETRELLGC